MRERADAATIREHIADKLGVDPGSVEVDGEEARCRTAPFTAFPLRIDRQGEVVGVDDDRPERLDLGPVRDYWRDRMGIADSPREQLLLAAVRRFLGRLTVTDPAALEEIRGQPAMFLANHQVGFESFVLEVVAAALGGRPIVAIAKKEHQATWLGQLGQLVVSYPGTPTHRPMVFFDRDDKASLSELMHTLQRILPEEGLSLLIHVEGTRALRCRQPVVRMSGALLELAIQAGLPVVPVRFAGGLPVETAPARREFPIGYAKQDIYIGAPIAPAQLANLPPEDRKRPVLEAMNALGPDLGREVPNPPDPEFAHGVAALMQKLAMAEPRAVILHMLHCDPYVHGPLRALVDAAREGGTFAGSGPGARWLQDLGAWFRLPGNQPP